MGPQNLSGPKPVRLKTCRPQNLSGPKPVGPETCQKIPLRYTTHQLTNTAAKLSPTPHQKGRKSAPRLRSVNKSQNVFFCDSNCVTT